MRILFALLLLTSTSLWSTPMCSTSFSTLQSYIDAGSTGCNIDNSLHIFGFSFTELTASGGNTLQNPTPSQIELAVLLTAPTPVALTDYAGLVIQSTNATHEFIAGQNISLHFNIGFWVEYIGADPTGGMTNSVLTASFASAGTGNKAHVKETVSNASLNTLGNMQVTQGQNGPKSLGYPIQSLIYVEKEFDIQGGPQSVSQSIVGPVYQNFVTTPEPGTWALLGTGLLGLGLFGRSRRK